ncbi:MAG: phosphatase PAP2 family protein [Gaiellaceae bacterium]
MAGAARIRAARLVAGHRDALREVVLAALAALAYFGVRNLTAGSAAAAYANANRLMQFENARYLDWERTLQEPVAASGLLTDLVNWVYIWGHWPVIITVAILLFRRRRDQYRLLRNAMLVSAGIGFLFFTLFPVAPPRLADPALVDTVTLHSSSYRTFQPPGLTDQYAAFPSLHFGWNVLVGIAVWGATTNVWLRALAVLGPAAMGAAVVLTANHYVVDVLAGLAVVLIGLVAHRLIVSMPLPSRADGTRDRPSGGQRPAPAAQGRGARDSARRSRRAPVAGTPRGSPPEDAGAASDPVGPVEACEHPSAEAPAPRSTGRRRCPHRAGARPQGTQSPPVRARPR